MKPESLGVELFDWRWGACWEMREGPLWRCWDGGRFSPKLRSDGVGVGVEFETEEVSDDRGCVTGAGADLGDDDWGGLGPGSEMRLDIPSETMLVPRRELPGLGRGWLRKIESPSKRGVCAPPLPSPPGTPTILESIPMSSSGGGLVERTSLTTVSTSSMQTRTWKGEPRVKSDSCRNRRSQKARDPPSGRQG